MPLEIASAGPAVWRLAISLGVGRGTESGEERIVRWRYQFQHPQSILAVGDIGKHSRRHHADLHVIHIVHDAIGIEDLIELRLLRPFRIPDTMQSLLLAET